LFLNLTRAAAENFHRSWCKRHGVVLDGEDAAVHYRRGALDAAAKLYEKVQLNFIKITSKWQSKLFIAFSEMYRHGF